MHLVYFADMNDRLGKSTDRLLTTIADLKSELAEVKVSKDRSMESLHEHETSFRLAQQRCSELEESCAGMKSEIEKPKSELETMKTSKDRDMESLRVKETASRLEEERRREQETNDDSRSDAPQSTTMKLKRSREVKVYDRHCQPDSQVNSYRQSSCSDEEAAVRAVIEQHGMSSTGTECRLALNCTDVDSFNYVFVEALQLLQNWLSEDRYFANMLQIACWDKRQNLVDLFRSFGGEIIEQSPGMVSSMILSEVVRYHWPCHHARILFNDMLPSDIDAMTIRLIETGFELIASRLDDHVLEARAASGKDALKCLFNILLRVITDYSYCVDILSTALNSGHETVIRTTLQEAVTHYRLQRNTPLHTVKRPEFIHLLIEYGAGAETQDICQKLFTASVRSGNSELVRMLLQLPQLRGYVDVNCVVDATTGDTALHLACRMGSTLINQSFDYDLCLEAFYVYTSLYRKAFSLAMHFEFEYDHDQKRHEAWSLACWSNYYRFVAALATADKDCARRLYRWRLLAMSSEILKLQLNVHFEEYVEVAQLLIQHGADVYARNKKGETALHVAASLQLHCDVVLEVCALCPASEIEKNLHWQRNCCLIGTLKTFREINVSKAQASKTYKIINIDKAEMPIKFKGIVSELFSPCTRLLSTVVSSYFENVTNLIRTLLQVGMDVNVTTNLDETALLIAAKEASKCVAFCREMYTLAATVVVKDSNEIAANEASKYTWFCREMYRLSSNEAGNYREKANAFGEFLRENVFTVVRELLLHDADWHIGGSNGDDLLNVALHSNQTDLLVELVCQGAQSVSWPEYLISVFVSETQSVIKMSLETLSSIGVTVDSRNDVGQTALHIAAERDLADIVRELISVGADTEAVDNAGRTPVQSAVESDSTNAMVAFGSRLPAERINMPNAMGHTGQTALHIAASKDRSDDVRRLLDLGADVEVLDEEGRSPLVTALVHGSWNSARAILDYRSDVVASSRMDVVVHSDGSTMLHFLCASSRWFGQQPTPDDIFRRVIDSGVTANVRDFYGNTPLLTNIQPEFIPLLIEYGADVNAQNDRGQTPLHIAFREGNVEVVRWLIQAGADLNVRDDFYNTPFHCDTGDDKYKYEKHYSEWKRLIPDLPQSVVQSDTLNMFGVPTVFKFMAQDDSPQQLAAVYRRNFTYFRATEYKDNKGKHLLPLHSEAAINATNSFGQTLLHLEWLEKGFRVEMDDSLHQRDCRGRTSWHHMFIFSGAYHKQHHVVSYIYDDCSLTISDVEKELEVLRMFPQVPNDFQSKRSMLNVAGCNEPDDVGRTPLHYAAMLQSDCRKCHVSDCPLYCKCCMFLFGIDSWFVQDKWGRTPLHYAYLNGNELPQFHMTILPGELTDVNRIQDIDGYTPKLMLDSYQQHEATCQLLQRIEQSCFDDFTKLLEHCKEKEFFQKYVSGESVDVHLKKLRPKMDASAFVWNIWTKLQYAYRDPDYPAVQAAVLDFMKRLVAAVGEEDHRFEGILHQVGSSFEGTRVGEGNEYDFNICLLYTSPSPRD